MEYVAVYIILIYLGIHAIRTIVAATEWVPHDWRFSWLVYGSGNRDIHKTVVAVLTELGISTPEIRKAFVAQNSPTYLLNEPDLQLMQLIASRIVQFSEKISYGSDTPTESRYYIDTMGAAHNPDDLRLMCRLIDHKVIEFSRKHNFPSPDFLLTPKASNPVLGRHYAQIKNVISVLHKDPKSRAYPRNGNPGSESAFYVRFEGVRELLQLAQEKQKAGAHTRGILVDCNASGGKQILQAMQIFNQSIKSLNFSIDPIDTAFILYRPDVTDDIDKFFADEGFQIIRYFDLDENTKKDLYDIYSKQGATSRSPKQLMEKLREYLKNNPSIYREPKT